MEEQPTPSSSSDNLLLIISDWICTYYSLALIIFGCFCNPLSFIVFSRKAFKDSTISIYLRILSVSDLGAILNGLLPYFLSRMSGVNLRVNDTGCVVSMYVYFFVLYTSSWTLVIVTTERVVSILQPHRVHIICSRSKIRITLGILFILIGLLSVPCPILLYKDLEIVQPKFNVTEVLHCAAVYVVDDVLPLLIVDTMMFAFLPCLLLIVFNIVIVVGVIKSRSRVMKHEKTFPSGHTKPASTKNSNYSEKTVDIGNTRSLKGFPQKVKKINQGQKKSTHEKSRTSRRSARESSLTITLVAVNITFILCNFPATAWGLGPQFQDSETSKAVDYAIIDLLLVLMYTNNSLNFVLYCATGTKFRAELRALFIEVSKVCRNAWLL